MSSNHLRSIIIATSGLLLLLTSCCAQWAGSGLDGMELAGSGGGSVLIPTEILETAELGSGDTGPAVSAVAVAAVPTSSASSSRRPTRLRRPQVIAGNLGTTPIRTSGVALTTGSAMSSTTILPSPPQLQLAAGSSPAAVSRRPPSVVIINDTRSALSQPDSVVFVGEGSNYLPVEHTRNRPRIDERDWRYPLDPWEQDYRRRQYNTSRVKHIEAECQEDHMRIRIVFNGSFTGLIYSTGYAYDPDCVYINGSGKDFYEFFIELNRCGTLGKSQEDGRKNPSKNLMWNTVTVQYNPLIEEEWDEHFKVTCEYGYDFWKTVSFRFWMSIATGNPVVFTLSPPECYMEIRHGFGLDGKRVAGPVRVGDELTLIIYMRSKYDGFDLVVNDCVAHNGGSKRIQLIDQYGCPVDDKLFSRFIGSWSEGSLYETQVFAYMKTFRFTGSPALYIECDVRMCHGRCPSQPCHWRNPKSKRSVEPATTAQPVSLSDNLNLYQSLKVLQDGEVEENITSASQSALDPNKVCLKTGAFTALFASASALVAILFISVMILFRRTRQLNKESALSEEMIPPRLDHSSFMTHKGRLN